MKKPPQRSHEQRLLQLCTVSGQALPLEAASPGLLHFLSFVIEDEEDANIIIDWWCAGG